MEIAVKEDERKSFGVSGCLAPDERREQALKVVETILAYADLNAIPAKIEIDWPNGTVHFAHE